jgi:hypothetical protein
LAGSGGFFSGADGHPITAMMKRIDKMIANSFLIDLYLLCEKVSDVRKSTRSVMQGRYSKYFYLVKINLSPYEVHPEELHQQKKFLFLH